MQVSGPPAVSAPATVQEVPPPLDPSLVAGLAAVSSRLATLARLEVDAGAAGVARLGSSTDVLGSMEAIVSSLESSSSVLSLVKLEQLTARLERAVPPRPVELAAAAAPRAAKPQSLEQQTALFETLVIRMEVALGLAH